MYLAVKLFCRRIPFFVYSHKICPLENVPCSQKIVLIKIVLIAPLAYAISERSFPTLNGIKTSMFSTMTTVDLLMIHVYKEKLVHFFQGKNGSVVFPI